MDRIVEGRAVWTGEQRAADPDRPGSRGAGSAAPSSCAPSSTSRLVRSCDPGSQGPSSPPNPGPCKFLLGAAGAPRSLASGGGGRSEQAEACCQVMGASERRGWGAAFLLVLWERAQVT
ncbi:hypothetical protein VULLAG_LOCUS21802 [Vulpes lagopus]